MANIHILFFLSTILLCSAEFADYMQVYEQECLGENRIHCSDGTCIFNHQYCDGKVDCLDGSDENLCTDQTPDPGLCNTTHHFLCEDKKKCIKLTWLCNNKTDCLDGSDEKNCTGVKRPYSDCMGFKCVSDKRCISKLWACDGAYDCVDNSDETPETCREYDRESSLEALLENCEDPWFHNKTYMCQDMKMCVPTDYMCNGMHDCKDGSDEGDFCANWKTMCTNETCPSHSNATCFPEREGPVCICPYYQYWDKATNTCIPMDMCSEARPRCSQICESRKSGAFLCHCEEGYLLDGHKIGYVCMAPDPEAMLFFSTRNEIKYFLLKSKKVITIATGVKQAHGLTYDGKFLYWVETAQGHQAIVRAQLDDVAGTKQVVVGLGLEDPGDIALDWLGGHIYFGDAQRGVISACTSNGSMCTTIQTDARVPKFITLNVRAGEMYWADWHHKPVIMRSRMDGSNARVLVDTMDSFAMGLAVDPPSNRLYFIDNTIKGVRLDDGRVFSIFDVDVYRPYALTVFENGIYFGDWNSNSIRTSLKLVGTASGPVTSVDSAVYGLHMYHKILMQSKSNPCAVNNCSHFCLLTSNETYACACPDGLQLDDTNNRTCLPIQHYRPQYLVVGSGSTFTRIQYNTLGNPETHAAHFDIGRVQAMAYDSLRDTLYIYDAQRKTINYINMTDFTRGVTRLLLYKGLENVVDMDYDYMTDSLYFVEAAGRYLEVVSLSTGKRALVHHFIDEIPVSLCVLPDYGKVLVAVLESEQNNDVHVDIFGLDGSDRKHILLNNLKGPHIRLRYARDMDNVFIADEGNSVIDYMHPQGSARETYRELSTTVTELAVTSTLVFWSDRRSSRLYWADIHDVSRNIRRIELSIFPNRSHLHIQATSQPPLAFKHPCQQNPCSDICVQIPRKDPLDTGLTEDIGYQCLCPAGMVNVDGNCSALATCKEEEDYCHHSNTCILKSSVCDGRKDCLHGEDEQGCEHKHGTCAMAEVMCEGKCTDKNKVCASTTSTPAPVTCRAGQFECVKDRLCIDRAQMCDGTTDCTDGSDEAQTLCSTFNCLHTEFMCASGHCVLKPFLCDGEPDCKDGSDENDCANKTCSKGFYQCRNLQCIELNKRCDQKMDCYDYSDEQDCEDPDLVDTQEEEEEVEEVDNCAEWEYTCEQNRSICLPLSARCNNKPDCPGKTDEKNCDSCRDGGFQCEQEDTKCVPRTRICDATKDCQDGTDETPAACARVNMTSRLYPVPVYPREQCHDGFQCENGQCVEWQTVCDQQPNCFDGSDEGETCATACDQHTCSHNCQPTPVGPHCRCPPGYELTVDQKACVDEDECAKDVCSQNCFNTVGSFVCSCHHGYALRFDRRSCKAITGNMTFLYVSGNSVRSITSDGKISVEFNDSKIDSFTDMDYDVSRRLMYATSASNGRLLQVNSTGSTVAVTNIGIPTMVAVDWITGNVYFVDATPGASRVRVCNIVRRRCAKLQKLPSSADVTALIVDPSARRMFYCITRDLESVIWSATFSGRLVTQVAVVQNCTGLAADSFKQRLYVAETGPAKIVPMDYNGNRHKKILTNDPYLQAPRHLEIFEDHIYFIVANSIKLNRCLLYGKKHCEMYLQRVFNAQTFIIKHESVQRDDLQNVCQDKCESLCVSGDREPMCMCEDGAVTRLGTCVMPPKEELPLFNGYTYVDNVGRSSYIVITVLLCMGALAIASAMTYFYCKAKGEGAAHYFPVRFRATASSIATSSLAASGSGTDSGSPAESEPSVQLPSVGASYHEFLNPMQMYRNFRQSLRRTRPVGTAGLVINVPPMDAPATASHLIVTDDHEQIVNADEQQ
ncbi:putative vitellogenin receptor [Pectinophora gossypiella]|uniref:putative vitellogenin receptor n=1 Tax=Pectinophora gossypiella TaxID=13191 RepID=UPI00214E3055|nr:putative vitellogenin receptor [Pectinophora gossypiella]